MSSPFKRPNCWWGRNCMVRSPSLPLQILVRMFLQSLPRIHKKKKNKCVVTVRLGLPPPLTQLTTASQANKMCCIAAVMPQEAAVESRGRSPLSDHTSLVCCSSLLPHVAPSKRNPCRALSWVSYEKHFEQISSVKEVLWEDFAFLRLSSSPKPTLPFLSAHLAERDTLMLLI